MLYKEVGPGLLESVSEVFLADMLREQNLVVERQKPISISFRGKRFEEGFRADLVGEGLVLVELKSVESLARVQRKQALTYLRLAQLKLGLLIISEEFCPKEMWLARLSQLAAVWSREGR